MKNKKIIIGIALTFSFFIYQECGVEKEIESTRGSISARNLGRLSEKRISLKENVGLTRGEVKLTPQKTLLETYDYFHSKIVKSDQDYEKIKKLSLDKKTHYHAKKTLLNLYNGGFHGRHLVEREVALSFLDSSLKLNPDNDFILNGIRAIVNECLKKRYDRNTQKSLNGDIVDLLLILDEYNPEFLYQMTNDDEVISHYYKYMKALKKG